VVRIDRVADVLGVLARIEVRQMGESLAVGSHSIYLAPPTSSHPLSYTPLLPVHISHTTPHSYHHSSSSIFDKSSITLLAHFSS
jgi:hypothetical protein